MKKLIAIFACVGGLAWLSTSDVSAAAFTPGDLVVVQDGDGSAGLTSSATAGFLDDYTTAGVFVQRIALPTAQVGLNGALTFSGSATSEGFLKLSADGNYLSLAGYNATPGTANPQTAVPTTIGRTVGVVDMLGNVNTTTILTDAYNGSNIRSAVSSDGVNIWVGGNGGSGQGASAATRYTTLGATTSTQLVSSNTNVRVVNIFNGQLYDDASVCRFLASIQLAQESPPPAARPVPR